MLAPATLLLDTARRVSCAIGPGQKDLVQRGRMLSRQMYHFRIVTIVESCESMAPGASPESLTGTRSFSETSANLVQSADVGPRTTICSSEQRMRRRRLPQTPVPGADGPTACVAPSSQAQGYPTRWLPLPMVGRQTVRTCPAVGASDLEKVLAVERLFRTQPHVFQPVADRPPPIGGGPGGGGRRQPPAPLRSISMS